MIENTTPVMLDWTIPTSEEHIEQLKDMLMNELVVGETWVFQENMYS